LDVCTTCGFLFLRNTAGIDFSSLYGEDYFSGEEYPDYLGQERALRRSMRRHLDQMAKFSPHGGDLFEVGAAYGFFLDEAKALYDSTKGIEISEAAADRARQAYGANVDVGDFTAIDATRQKVDVVCMWDTIEHVPGADLFVGKAHELLSDGGWLFLTTGDLGSLNARVRGSRWRQIHPPSHVNYFSRATIRRLLTRLGFRVAGIETAAYYHTLYDVLATIELRGGPAGRVARTVLRVAPRGLADRLGFWINLGDTMFVAAQRV
jgi:methyltransferase family protein